MPHPKTIKKVVRVLRQLQKHLSTAKHFDLTATLRANKMPHDYSKIISRENALIKIDGGTRGAASYIWNKDKSPNEELATQIITAYNKNRNEERRNREGGNGRTTNEKRLIKIESMLKSVLSYLKIK